MFITDSPTFRLASALALGLLIGAERERRKGKGHLRSPAGIRTFALTSVLGGVSFLIGGDLLLAVAASAIAAFCAVSYIRTSDQDPGLTTETALVLTVLLGGLAQQQTATASGIAVMVTILLAARTRLHEFVRSVLTEEEMTDAIIFAAAVLVILPLTPNRYLGPYSAINPRTIWKIVILIMSISAAGHIAVRVLGARFGLPTAGLASGFVSSTATIAAANHHCNQVLALSPAHAILARLRQKDQFWEDVSMRRYVDRMAGAPASIFDMARFSAYASLSVVIFILSGLSFSQYAGNGALSD